MIKDSGKDETVEGIKVFWQIMDGWNELSYDKKLEYYWLYRIVDGKRIYG